MKTIDIFPAVVKVNGETITKSRVRVEEQNEILALNVWVENPKFPHDPKLLINLPVTITFNTIGDSSVPNRKQMLTVQSIFGQYTITRQGGCGCGSKLKHMRLKSGSEPPRSDIEEVIAKHWAI